LSGPQGNKFTYGIRGSQVAPHHFTHFVALTVRIKAPTVIIPKFLPNFDLVRREKFGTPRLADSGTEFPHLEEEK
jgi:hypothetical protein